jgi:predicted HAD superfamily Cof-like phosphohydrolase
LAQVTELQTALNDRVMAAPHRRVAAFHAMIGAPVNHTPAVPPDDRVRLRLRLVVEEVVELIGSCMRRTVPGAASPSREAMWLAACAAKLALLIDHARFDVDLPGVADALADIDYVVEGTRLEFGIHGPPIAALVHAANMAKVGGPVDAHGKHGKPPGWTPPDIAGELVRQGWRLVHCVSNGAAICGRTGVPREWSTGEQWVDSHESHRANCPDCLRVLAESKRQEPVSP